MTEQLFNSKATTLQLAANAAQTTVTVGSAADFPPTGSFDVRVDLEIMCVTAVAGNILTVTRGQGGTIATTHAAGSQVRSILSAESLRRFVDEWAEGPELIVASVGASDAYKASADYVCDGVADEVQINAALAAVPAAGGSVLINGAYTIAGAINFAKGKTRLRGTGFGTIITVVNAGGSPVNTSLLNNIHAYCAMEDFWFDGNAANNAGATSSYGILLSCTYSRVSRVNVFNVKGAGIATSAASLGNLIENCMVSACGTYGFIIDNAASVQNEVTNCLTVGNAVYGYYVAGYGAQIKDCRSYGNGSIGFYVAGPSVEPSLTGCSSRGEGAYGFYSVGLNGAHLAGCTAVSTNNAGFVAGPGAVNMTLAGCKARSCGGVGFSMEGSGHVVDGCDAEFSGFHGIQVSSSDSRITNNTVMGNGTAANATYDGIIVTGNDNTVKGNMARIGAGSNRQRYGLAIASGASRTDVGGNDLAGGGVTGALLDSGTDTRYPVREALAYTASTDLHAGTALPVNTWIDVIPNQTFKVLHPKALVMFTVDAGLQTGNNATPNSAFSARLAIDAPGTANAAGTTNLPLAGDMQNAAGVFVNPAGSAAIPLSSLAVGSHTVKLQVLANVASILFLRASSTPNTEFLKAGAVEYAGT